MNEVKKIGLSVIGGGLATFGLTLIGGNFWLGLVAILVGAGIVVTAAVLTKKGFPVGREK
ncbi:MAG TPA: hypothetical protein ENH85_11515 [Candidatus Scalindua sp.]|nr:hypothetical protein [Candidatus Scalindua sp.]